MARTVRMGATIGNRDVVEARVAADSSVHAIPASAIDTVVGRVAAVTLVGGTLVTRAELASGPVIPEGSSVVGLAIKPGFAPVGLRAGASVQLVLTRPDTTGSDQSATDAAPVVLAEQAQVFDAAVTPDGQGQIVSVIVDDPSAPAVAAAGARGEVSIVLLGGAR
jgi:flagella basal body P-ring formation protein FlgA